MRHFQENGFRLFIISFFPTFAPLPYVNITAPNQKVSITTVCYVYLILDLSHASNDNLIMLIEAL